MSFETLALIWPAFIAALVVGVVLAMNWFEDRAERRNSR
jgi:flagellar biosynthesis protein FliQ